MIKAIIFDCFGVLATEGWEPYCQEHFGDKPELMRQARNLSKQLNSGLIDYDTFIPKVAKLAGVSEDQARSVIDDNVPNKPLFNYIKNSLKPKYKIGLLSNAGDNWLDEIFTPDHLALIDEYVLSYATSFIKPQREIYELIAKKLGVEPNECILVDDRQKHIDGAQNSGMKAILYEDFSQMKTDLEELLADSNR